jgi:hypothetical protein
MCWVVKWLYQAFDSETIPETFPDLNQIFSLPEDYDDASCDSPGSSLSSTSLFYTNVVKKFTYRIEVYL